jgi:hypothetical protein
MHSSFVYASLRVPMRAYEIHIHLASRLGLPCNHLLAGKMDQRVKPAAIMAGVRTYRPQTGHGGQRMGKTLLILLGTSLNTCQNFGIT